MTVYAVNYDNGFGITEDILRVVFMVEEQSNASCTAFVDRNQAYLHACKTYAEKHARYEFGRSFPMPRLEDFSVNDMFETPGSLPFSIRAENRYFSVIIYNNGGGMNIALLSGVAEFANCCRYNIVTMFQELPNEALAKEWIWKQCMIPIIALSAYIYNPICLSLPNVGEIFPVKQPTFSSAVKNILLERFSNNGGVKLPNANMGGFYENV